MKQITTPIIFSIAIIIAFLIAAGAYKQKFKSTETIVVTGLADKDFTSDQIVWRGTINKANYDLKIAYSAVKEDEKVVKQYLQAKGLPDSSVEFSSIDVQKNYNTKFDANGSNIGSEFSGFNLTITVKVDSKNIQLVERISREVTELLQKGIEFNSNKPSYYFSGLNNLKIDLLAKASADAKLRAETIAKSSNVGIGSLKKATMGVFQITGKNDNEDYSYGGSFNTSSKEKTASITLKVEYEVQ